ncbi:hypothetical protein H0H92_011540 [Tricholoma furcatifolium]|nr:hypothetical protein H0H92_011540 [Tricholoma furcatifolium]
MSDDMIILATPPASPSHIDWHEDEGMNVTFEEHVMDLPSDVFDSQPSPTKRPRAYPSRTQKRQKRTRSNVPSGSSRVLSQPSNAHNVFHNEMLHSAGHDLEHEIPTLHSPIASTQSPNDLSSPPLQPLSADWSQDGPDMLELLLPPSIGDADHPDRYSEFVEAVFTACLGFYRITASVFVVQGWDTKTATPTRRWYHLQAQKIGLETVNICLCPYDGEDCVHCRFLTQFGQQEFFDDEDFPLDIGRIQLVFRDIVEGCHLFSVETPGKHGLKPRAMVQHEGNVDGGGIWRCSKDGSHGCSHVQMARDYLQQLIYMNPAARDESELTFVGKASAGVANNTSSVSFKPIAPPVWAELDTDLPLAFPRPSPITASPRRILLEEDARCMCGASRNTRNPVVVNACRVYGLLRCYDAEIELQRCTQCAGGRQRFVGPDCRERGLFNYNNRIVFSHDLLDDYTMAYTSSETPFAAWVSVAVRRYKVHGSLYPFVNETIFRAAWFGYARHLALDGDFQCSRCGPVPQEPIFDGVVVAFSKSRILHSLCPPTTPHIDSSIRSSHFVTDKAPIAKAKLRKNLRQVVQDATLINRAPDAVEDERDGESGEGSSSEQSDTESGAGGNQEPATHAQRQINKDQGRRLALLPSVQAELCKINDSLGNLFQRLFSESRAAVPSPYKRLFMQISSRESILQVANERALGALQTFNDNPSVQHMTLLLEIPCIYNVLMHENMTQGHFSADVLGVCRWIHARGQRILHKLKTNTAGIPPTISPGSAIGDEWIKTGSYYSMPQIRHRPTYPKIPDDNSNDFSGKRSAHCSKYYARYSQQRMTGGIMAVWCTHSICYGFHTIPSGEGRNDVFSALITRWEQAPRIIVYDFACALGPYCLTREPEFFANTLFVVDDFHSDGHTCGDATTLKAYCEVDLRLSRINSSAAECGNGGLARIKKSASYMTQERAIIYTKVFISIWNRLKLIKMKS